MFACTWVALHLDVPKNPNQSMWRSFWWKFGWMICALIAPEYVAARATADLFTAKKYMDNWNANFAPLCSPKLVEIPEMTTTQYQDELKYKHYDSRWTLTHGFLAWMNGIRLYKEGDDYLRSFQPRKKLFKDPKMRPIIQRIGLISSKDIEDKSKGDWISKSFVVFQTTWFIIQCVARWATHLPVTELEVVTFAYAVLNVFIYALWWNKPQGLSVPYRFYVANDEDSSENLEVRGDSRQEEVPLIAWSPRPTLVGEAVGMNALSGSESRSSRKGRKRGVSGHEWVQPTCSGSQGLFNKLKGEFFFVALAGTNFGGLHLIPVWLSVFPSNAEKILWWVSAFFVTAVPTGVAFAGPAIARCDVSDPELNDIVVSTLGMSLIGAYAVARVILLVLPFTTLRSLPAEALLSVAWTRFMPHF